MSKVKRTPPKPPAPEKPSALEYAVGKYMREHVPRKKTKFLHHPVEYFTASRAVDVLLDSPWATDSERQPALFTDRQSVVDFLDGMLRRKFFHRAKKVAISDRDLRRKQLKKLKKLEEEEKRRTAPRGDSESERDDRRTAEERSAAEDTAAERSAVEGEASPKASGKDGDDGKPKRRIKLDMHLEQLFVDGTDAYVWIYDPIPTYYWLLGSLIVAAIVAVCLFPLWPSKMRHVGGLLTDDVLEYVYYLSLAAAGFLVVILVLAVVRVVVFCLLWLVTWGRHQLWLLPNLTEDVGFFASFWPLYQYEYHGKTEGSASGKKSKKRTTEKTDGDQKVSWGGAEGTAEKENANRGDNLDGEQAENNDTPAEGDSDSDQAE
ncbi:Translocation protein SEC62 [Amphibalanus amphitrite]|uniref:Translocation protein SEC62 n=1 Tax=Amphibalanus amphitrite TaxID=1232801 RepID=A0A6A4XDM2_AMPAM|nr:Translocation protein SEC62 [Amphibalanus amphitrite]